MKKLYLHIGSPKTGTTAIQHMLHNSRAELERQGYIYPGEDLCHHKFYFSTKQEKLHWPRQFKGVSVSALEKVINEYFAGLLRDFKEKDGVFLISTEYLFIDDPEAIGNVVDFLSGYFSDIEVVVYVRCPVGYYASSQQQLIKARSYVESPESFLYNFKNVILSWKDKARVTVMKHEPDVDSRKKFCDYVGLDFNLLSKEGENNSSISLEQMMVLEKIQKNLYPHAEDIFKSHLGVVSQVGFDYLNVPRLKARVKDIVYKNHYNDLEWLRKKHGVSFLRQERAIEMGGGKFPENPHVCDIYEDHAVDLERYESALLDKLMKLLVLPKREVR